MAPSTMTVECEQFIHLFVSRWFVHSLSLSLSLFPEFSLSLPLLLSHKGLSIIQQQCTQGTSVSLYLSPVFKEIGAEHILFSIVMVKHLGKKSSRFLSFCCQLHWFSIVVESYIRWEALIGWSKVRSLV